MDHIVPLAQQGVVTQGVPASAFTTRLCAGGLVWQELHGRPFMALFSPGDFYEMEGRVLLERLGLGG